MDNAFKGAVNFLMFFYGMNYYNTLATKVNLVLNDNKQSQVSGNTWTTKDNDGNEVSFTFKSITFVD